MRLNYEGRDYTFDLEEITLQQARTIKSQCGITLLGLEAGLENGDPDALRAIFWLMLVQNGEQADIDRVDCKIVKFARAIDAAVTEGTTEETPKDSTAEASPQ
jgi:hypothetical protein